MLGQSQLLPPGGHTMPPGMMPPLATQMNHYNATPQPVYGKAPMRENSMDDLNINGLNHAGATTMHTSNPNLL